MYDVYLDKMLLPITPAKIQLKVTNQNKTVQLVNEGEVNLLKKPGLTDISFTAMIPQQEYPFAQGGTRGASYYLGGFERLKTGQKPFQFIVSRVTPMGKVLFNSNLKVSLEEYTVNEDAKNGFDLMVDIELKQFRPYGTKTVKIKEPTKPADTAKAEMKPQRPSETAPQTKNYTVATGDTLWAIAKKYYGNGNDYTKIYEANKGKISNPNLIYTGQELVIP